MVLENPFGDVGRAARGGWFMFRLVGAFLAVVVIFSKAAAAHEQGAPKRAITQNA